MLMREYMMVSVYERPSTSCAAVGIFVQFKVLTFFSNYPHFKLSCFFVFSYTTYVMLTAGTTFSKLGVKPLNNPPNPSPRTVWMKTSLIPPGYVLGCNTVP